jgi:hypothetical protein
MCGPEWETPQHRPLIMFASDRESDPAVIYRSLVVNQVTLLSKADMVLAAGKTVSSDPLGSHESKLTHQPCFPEHSNIAPKVSKLYLL